MRRCFGFTLLVVCLLSAAPGLALRCENGLVAVGDRKAEVLARCGPPASTELVAVEKTADRADGPIVSEVPVERWSYNFGPKSFLQVLTFRGDVLARIETGDRVSTSARPSDRLRAAIGDTMAEVWAKNGEPFLEELVGTETGSTALQDSPGPGVTRVEVPIDRWSYRFGPGRFMQVLTFKGGRLVQIETGARE